MNAFAVLATTASLVLTIADAPQAPASGRIAEPMIIDVRGDGFSLTTVQEGVRVDVDGDGQPEQVAWTSAGSDDAFVCIDNNKDGVIQVPSELLGGTTGPPVGFAYLAAMDGISSRRPEAVRDRHPDGVIDKSDAIYGELILWTDSNHNGRSEEDELESLEHAGIQQIASGYEGTPSVDASGNRVRYRAQARLTGKRGLDVAREVITVRLARQ